VAGLLFAIKVADHGRVHIITKRNMRESSTAYAQGGIASVFGQEDSFDLHISDTLASGDGLCHEDVVQMVVRQAPERIRELIHLGVGFNRDNSQASGLHLDLSREGGHSQNRIVHAADLTGLAVEKALIEKAKQHPNIQIFENHIAIDLITRSTRLKRGLIITTHEDYCYGAYVLDRFSAEIHTFCAKNVVLATGGAGKVYAYTSNPDIASGDGIAMAYRAGAIVANLEFVQFHPTCLFHPAAKNFLISEAVRGEEAGLLRLGHQVGVEAEDHVGLGVVALEPEAAEQRGAVARADQVEVAVADGLETLLDDRARAPLRDEAVIGVDGEHGPVLRQGRCGERRGERGGGDDGAGHSESLLSRRRGRRRVVGDAPEPSLRRHDPVQVRRVCAARASQLDGAPRGEP